MANELYGYHNPSLPPRQPPNSTFFSSSRSLLADPYVPPSFPSSTSFLTSSLSDRYFSSDPEFSALSYAAPPPHSLLPQPPPHSLLPQPLQLIGTKRSTRASYEQSLIGTHNIIGQNEAWLSTNMLAKRPRFESTSNLPVFPQRPGDVDCAHYMLTRTCKFGDACKFDHPIWVPEGGIPDWKEVQQMSGHPLNFPERPGEPDCPYFLKTGNCKYGSNCRFNHPKHALVTSVTLENVDASTLPERPSDPSCAYYLYTGKCKFGANCKFHHPKDITIPSTGSENAMGKLFESPDTNVTRRDADPVQKMVTALALLYNSKGLPVRLGELECPFYMKTGSCKFGSACRYSHPAGNSNNPAALNHSVLTSPAMNLNLGLVDPSASILRSIDARLAQTTLGVRPIMYPQRPGSIECDGNVNLEKSASFIIHLTDLTQIVSSSLLQVCRGERGPCIVHST